MNKNNVSMIKRRNKCHLVARKASVKESKIVSWGRIMGKKLFSMSVLVFMILIIAGINTSAYAACKQCSDGNHGKCTAPQKYAWNSSYGASGHVKTCCCGGIQTVPHIMGYVNQGSSGHIYKCICCSYVPSGSTTVSHTLSNNKCTVKGCGYTTSGAINLTAGTFLEDKYQFYTSSTASNIQLNITGASTSAYKAAVGIKENASDSWTGIPAIEMTANGSGKWKVTLDMSDYSDGTYMVGAQVVESGGNFSVDFPTVYIIIDNTAPTATASDKVYGNNVSINLSDSLSGIKYWAVTTTNKMPTTSGTTCVTTGNTLDYWYKTDNVTSATVTFTKKLDVATYYVWCKDLCGNTGYSTFKITKASITPKVTMEGYTYGVSKNDPIISGNSGDGKVTYFYSASNKNTGGTDWANVANSTSLNAGTYYIYANVAATKNYNAATTSAVEFKIEKGNPIATVSIVGVRNPGETLSASVSTLTNGAKTYQWWYSTSSTATSGTNISGQTGSTYLITADMQDKYVGCTVNIAEGTNYKPCIGISVGVLIQVAAKNYSVGSLYYSKLSEAYAAVKSSGTTGTIKVEESNVDSSVFEVENGYKVTINTNGKTVTKASSGLVNNGELIITGTGIITTERANINAIATLISNNGTLEIESGTLINEGLQAATWYALENSDSGNITINGGTIKTILSSGVTSTNYGRTIGTSGTLNINGGIIKNESMNGYTILDWWSGNSGLINITAGTITNLAENAAVHVSSNSKDVSISGGTIEGGENGVVYSSSGTLEVTGGKIVGDNCGIYNASLSSTIIIGEEGAPVSVTTPEIKGEKYGIDTISGFEFYDGILKGITDAYNNKINERENGYDIKIGTEGSYTTATLIECIPKIISLLINGGNTTTKNLEVIVEVEAENSTEMYISNTNTMPSDAEWMTFKKYSKHKLTSNNANKTIYVWTKNQYGRVSEVKTANISLEATYTIKLVNKQIYNGNSNYSVKYALKAEDGEWTWQTTPTFLALVPNKTYYAKTMIEDERGISGESEEASFKAVYNASDKLELQNL